MRYFFSKTLLASILATIAVDAFAQDKDFEELSKSPKDKKTDFPLDYKIIRPGLSFPTWHYDMETYNNYITHAMEKTQMSMSYNQNGVVTQSTANSVSPHAQLDTATIIDDPKRLIGTWRMIKYRVIRYNDSIRLATKTYYRLKDTLLGDKSDDEAFAVISDNTFKMYVKETGKTRFKKVASSQYKLENRKFIMLYKLVKSSAGVSQIGIDEKDRLIMNYPRVVQFLKPEEYFSYYTDIEQYIFDKVK